MLSLFSLFNLKYPEKSYLINLQCLRFISNCVIVIFVITNESTLSPLVDEVLHGLLLYQVEAHEVETEADQEVDHAADQLVGVIVV